MTQPPDILDGNISRLIGAALAAPEDTKLDLQPVMQALAAERRRRARRTWSLAGVAACAAAVAMLVLSSAHKQQVASPPADKPVLVAAAGQVKTLYGLVSLSPDRQREKSARQEEVGPGQWIRTHTGSQAELELVDKSRMTFQPRTSVQLLEKKDGQKVMVDEGSIAIQAAHQAPGKSLTIQTPNSQITVLGTELDVRVGQTAAGKKLTRVAVTSGKVRIESASKEAILQANMEGLVEEGLAPVVRSLTAEVNDLAALVARTHAMAAEKGLLAGDPALVQFNADASATVWSVLTIDNPADAPLVAHVLHRAQPQESIQAFTLEGLPLGVTCEGDGVRVDLSANSVRPKQKFQLIVKVSGVKDLFQGCGAGEFEIALPARDGGTISLLQLALPPSTYLADVVPPPVEVRKMQGRLVVTIPAQLNMAKILR